MRDDFSWLCKYPRMFDFLRSTRLTGYIGSESDQSYEISNFFINTQKSKSLFCQSSGVLFTDCVSQVGRSVAVDKPAWWNSTVFQRIWTLKCLLVPLECFPSLVNVDLGVYMAKTGSTLTRIWKIKLFCFLFQVPDCVRVSKHRNRQKNKAKTGIQYGYVC